MYWLRSSVGACLLSLASYDPRSARCGRAGRGPFGPTSRLSRSGGEESPGRAVVQRRSRASGLTRPLAEAIRGFGLGFVVGPLARSAAVCSKSFVSSRWGWRGTRRGEPEGPRPGRIDPVPGSGAGPAARRQTGRAPRHHISIGPRVPWWSRVRQSFPHASMGRCCMNTGCGWSGVGY